MPADENDQRYTVRLPDDFWEVMGRLADGHVNKVMEFLRDHVQVCPRDRCAGLKELRGEWRGHYQYDVSKSLGTRLIYTVDVAARTVDVVYFGSHPSWSRAKDRQNL